MKLTEIIDSYIGDSAHYDDFDDNVIQETLNGLRKSLKNLTEQDTKSYVEAFKTYKKSLTDPEKVQVCEDFIEYCKHYK